jgi:hypothetical protein
MAIVNPKFSILDIFPSYQFEAGRISIALTDLPALSSTEAAAAVTGDAREFLRAILEEYSQFLKSRASRPALTPKHFSILKSPPAGTSSNEFTQTYTTSFAISVSPNNMTIKAELDVAE